MPFLVLLNTRSRSPISFAHFILGLKYENIEKTIGALIRQKSMFD